MKFRQGSSINEIFKQGQMKFRHREGVQWNDANLVRNGNSLEKSPAVGEKRRRYANSTRQALPSRRENREYDNSPRDKFMHLGEKQSALRNST
ncbi:hypothetical protein TNCV_4558721 [Trichonephila clavipes]|nr:hypothetical protein TNCV_4558721 [Trichonephila clavipes]